MAKQIQSNLTYLALIILWAIYLLVIPGCVTVTKNYYPVVKRDTVYIQKPVGWHLLPSWPNLQYYPSITTPGISYYGIDTLNLKYDSTVWIVGSGGSDTLRIK